MDTSLGGARVVRVLERLCEEHEAPERIMMDNGPEFTGKALDAWAYSQKVMLEFIRPGKPMENSYVESFMGVSTASSEMSASTATGSPAWQTHDIPLRSGAVTTL